jgi:hypothetical protein
MIVCNASIVAVKYSETMNSILPEDARRKTFVQNLASEVYTIQSTGDRPQHRGKSSSRGPNLTRNRSKSKDLRTRNYCKKPGHIKADCRALKAKNKKFKQKGNCIEEVNFCGSSSMDVKSMEDDPNIQVRNAQVQ